MAIIAAAMYLTNTSYGQETKPKPDNKIELGFSFGTNYSLLYLGENDPSKATRLSSVNGLGFRLGILATLPLFPRVSLTAKPELSFNDNNLGYTNSENKQQEYEMPTTGEIAVHVSYKLSSGSTHPYVLFGPAYKLPLTSSSSDYYQITRPALALDAGVGLEHLFKHFKIAPELRYSYNVNNISSVSGIKDVRYHVLSLSLMFWG